MHPSGERGGRGLMPGALLLLLRLRLVAYLRRTVRRARSPGQVVLLVLGVLLMAVWLGSVLLSVALHRRAVEPGWALEMGPVILMALAVIPPLLSGSRAAIAFSPAETEFLFAGPFTRRQLLLYRIVAAAALAPLGGLFFSIWLSRFAGSPAGGYLGATLALVFAHLVGMLVALGTLAITERAYTRARRAALLVVLAGAAAALARVLPAELDSGALLRFVRGARNSDAGRVIFWPAEAFVRVFAAREPGQVALWSLAALGVNAVLVGVVLLLDVQYQEAALAAGERRSKLIEQKRAGRASVGAGSARLRLPGPPVGGTGVLLVGWRQGLGALRGWKGWVAFLLLFPAMVAVPLLKGGAGFPVAAALAPMGVMALFLLPMAVRFDFRGDLDVLEPLKALPLRPWAVAAGQLVAPVAIVVSIEALTVGVAAGLGGLEPRWAAYGLLGALPLTVTVLAIENGAFLLFPTRTPIGGPPDFQRIARQFALAVARLLAIGLGGGLAVGGAALVHALSGSFPAAFATGWVVLAAIAAALVWGLGVIFRRFDVTRDTPGA